LNGSPRAASVEAFTECRLLALEPDTVHELKRKFPEYKVVTNKESSITRLINQTYMFEKFHLILFVFFCLATVYAIVESHVCWTFIISLTNIAYNIYPNLLQQYIRLKLAQKNLTLSKVKLLKK